MKDDDVERRAKALADVILELLFAKDFRDADRVKRDDRQRTLAENEAYWIVYSLKDPAGEVGLWNAKKQVKLLETALKGLGKAKKAIRELALPLALPIGMKISRRTKLESGLATPSLLIRELSNALSDMKEKIRGDTTDQGRLPVRLDRRRWSAIMAYLGLRRLWENYRDRAPARIPKDSDPFYEFAERAFEALEIEGIGGREHASVRSVLDALGELKKQGIILIPS